MAKTVIEELGEFGQSVWLDNISRSLIESGKLKEMIGLGIRGMTSNPTIFDKAISLSDDYDETIRELYKSGKSTFEIYDDLTIKDVQEAADIFRPVYDRTNGRDGYVSLEINPKLASKTRETIEEGKRLHEKVNRPNVLFKVPSTEAGFEAIEELLSQGINVNVTLIFSLEQYKKTAEAFLKGIDRLSQNQGDLSNIHSVASIFVSRIETVADGMIDERMKKEMDAERRNKLKALKGKAAVANAKIIFAEYLDIFSGSAFRQLEDKGASVQRVLWASTGTKNPDYSDIKYVSELIAGNTVNTVPDKTIEAFLDHGEVKEAVTGDARAAQGIVEDLKGFGIDIDNICAKLLEDGVVAFEKSFEALLHAIETKIENLCPES
ncbi:MAG: transaldolase [Nitrospirae bacterium]|nr:transaldolase [Nitrospirota bacterium]